MHLYVNYREKDNNLFFRIKALVKYYKKYLRIKNLITIQKSFSI